MNKKVLAIVILVLAAVAVLIILPIITSTLCCHVNNPADKTIELLSDLYNKPESIKTTQMAVTLTPEYVLSASALSESTSLSAKNICMSLGDFEGNSNFEIRQAESNHTITWKGSSNQNVKVAVTCNINREKLMEGIEGTMFEEFQWAHQKTNYIGPGKP